MKKLLLLLLVTFAFVSTRAGNVTFSLDMNAVTDLYEGGSVWIYLDSDWNEYYNMTDDDSDGIYTYTLSKDTGTVQTFSYSYQNGADEWTNYVTENVPADCADDNGWRTVTFTAEDQTLDAVAYGACPGSAPLSKVNVTFTVDMTGVEVENNDVQVVIKNPWIWTALADQGDGTWSATVELEDNATYPYTFVNGGKDNWGGEEKLTGECNMGSESAPERQVEVVESDILLETVPFGQCASAVSEPDSSMITIQVDMNAITDLYEGGAVWIYMDADWNEYYYMSDDDADGIYSYTISNEAGKTITYSFSYQNGADEWTNYVTENVPADCADDNGWRTVIFTAEDQTLDTVAYGACPGSAPLSKVNVTFTVDMTGVEVENNDVQVVIKNPWIWTALADQGDGKWSATVELDPNATYPYTFVNGGQDNWGGEEKVDAACNFGSESAPERRVEVAEEDFVLPNVAFGACPNEPVETSVTALVDMNTISDIHNNIVWIYFDSNWSEYYVMDDSDGDGIYSYTMDKEAGETFVYSFSYQNGPNENSDYVTENVPADCSNDDGFRSIVLNAGNNVLEAVAFGSCDAFAPSKVKVTFQVDMNNTEVANNDVQVVIKNPWKWTTMTEQGDGVWKATVELDANATYPYTFVNGGQDNWNGEEKIEGNCNYGTDAAPERHVDVGNEDITLDLVSFGSCEHIDVAVNELANNGFKIFPNPVNNQLFVTSEIQNNHQIQMIDMTGRLVLQRDFNENSINLNISNLNEGIYLIIINTDSKSISQRILIQR